VVVEFKCSPARGKSKGVRMSLKLQDRLKVLEKLGEMVGAFKRKKNSRRKSTAGK
jgi:hypothetical protein